MYIRKVVFYLFILSILFLLSCADLVSDQNKKAIVTTLYEGPAPMGEYKLFWNGKDDDNVFVPAGTYYVRLYSRNFTFTREITAQEGSGGASNNTGNQIFDSYQGMTEIKENIPEPFRIQDGTMIIFTVGEIDDGQSIELTIRDEK